MKKIVLFFIIKYLTLLLLGSGQTDYVTRYVNQKPKRCIPYYNCKPGHEILPCIEEYTQERCVPCHDDPSTSEPDFVQPDYISSVDGEINDLGCFRPLKLKNGQRAQCTSNELLYSKKNSGAHCLSLQGCKCNLNKCYYGDPCLCDYYLHKNVDNECDVDNHLNASGVCVPCPDGYQKDHVGCGPCLRKENFTILTTKPPQVITTSKTKETTPKPTPSVHTETTSSDTFVVVGTAVIGTEKPSSENNSTIYIIVGVVVALTLVAVILICFLYRKGKFECLKTICHGTRTHQNQEVINPVDEEMAPLNHPELMDVNIRQVGQNHITVNDKQDNININRNNSYCPSQGSDRVVFNSGSSISVNRQLSDVSNDGRINSNTSECRLNSNASESSPLIRPDINPHEINRAFSVNECDLYRIKNEVYPPILRHSESVPQQVSHTDHGDTCVSCGSPTSHGTAMRLPASPVPASTFAHYPENSGGACIPLPDFSNIQSSNPVMNTELPNIAEFKRSLSKDSESSVDLSASSPFNSIPEETGKELQEEVAVESAVSSVTVEPPHISDVTDYNNCHLSNVMDVPQPSDITNQIDSRLEQYNHTYTGLDDNSMSHKHDDTAACSVQRFPSEHEEETIKKNDLDSNLDSGMSSKLDSGMASKMEGDSDLSTKSET